MSAEGVNFVTCACKHCGGHIEYDQEFNAGFEVDCPHCGFKTLLANSQYYNAPSPPLPPDTPSPHSNLTACPDCGREVSRRAASCPQCGAPIAPPAARPPAPQQVIYATPRKSRLAYIIVGLFLGALGIHNFYAGHTARGLVQLAITVTIGWSLILPLILVWIWNIYELFAVTEDGQGRDMV